MRKVVIAFVCMLVNVCCVQAQHSDPAKYSSKLKAYQDSLKELSGQIINEGSEPERMNASYSFAKMLVRALKTPGSFNFSFDSLKAITIETSPDKRLRIFTWHVMFNDGSYRYYGAIQMNSTDGKLQLHGLTDYSPLIKKPADTVTTNDKWYGAQYYKIIPVSYNARIPYYVLLGWKGNTVKSNKKVVEILYFKDGKPYFGMPVFDGDPDNAKNKRIVFEYSRQASMLLNYKPDEGMIVFDHIAPRDNKMKGNFEAYGPDMSYDGYKIINGRLKLISDIPLKNMPDAKDEEYSDPKKPKSAVPRKL